MIKFFVEDVKPSEAIASYDANKEVCISITIDNESRRNCECSVAINNVILNTYIDTNHLQWKAFEIVPRRVAFHGDNTNSEERHNKITATFIFDEQILSNYIDVTLADSKKILGYIFDNCILSIEYTNEETNKTEIADLKYHRNDVFHNLVWKPIEK